ncbi:uncharacterized protein LOC113343659 [Papaver somniferum]|uniref:uncharacterized protein LOC113343659 n=1 Tax=Papaver somniferum TaxID=3469 RepID=UPI000E704463|nr:uncharacterized protein LOC113343659 [Papaver somniferum]
MFMHIIGNVEKTKFYTNLWHPNGKLVDWVNKDTIDELCYGSDCRVADFLDNEGWYFPDAMKDELQQTVLQLKEVDFDMFVADMVVWKPRKFGEFTVKDTYIALDGEKDDIMWKNLVWFKSHMPRYSFITRLCLHGGLKTKDKMVKWGLLSVVTCVLCEEGPETEEHLFHSCIFL